MDINGKNYSEFLLFLMTIPNENLFADKKYINNHLSHEISTFTNYFYQETDLKVKEAFNTYLANREGEFKKVNDLGLEERLFNRVKKSLAPKYWSEMVNYFPNLVEKDKGIIRDNLVESEDVKLYQVNFNKGAFYKLCPSIVDSEDLRVVFSFIHSMIVSTKPEEISIMQIYETDHDIKITFSGKDIDESYKQKVAKIYRLVAEEYNSDNIIKYDPKMDDKNNNITYLRKVSEMYWLEVMLENSTTNKNKKMKM